MTEAASVRFTSDGSPALETLIAEHMRLIAERLWQSVNQGLCDALILGGGYGRGEGGVLQTDDGERPIMIMTWY